MNYKDHTQLKKDIAAGKLENAYLLYGSEEYLVRGYAGLIADKAIPGEKDAFRYSRLSGEKLDVDLLYDTVEALPLMGGSKLVWVDGLEADKLSPEQFALLEQILSDVPPSCVLLITAAASAFGAKKSAREKKILAHMEKAGATAEMGKQTPGDLAKFLVKQAKQYGCTISTALCRELINLCGGDMLVLQGEIAKVCAYAGGGEVLPEHLSAVAVPKMEARVFDLTKEILAENYKGAMEILANLFYLRESPVAILAVMAMTYADLYRAKIAGQSGLPAVQMIGDFGYKGREFRVNNALRLSQKLSVEYLRHSVQTLLALDLRLKSAGADGRALLEEAVTTLFVLRKKYW
ncbi:DNA polymerase III subunit delta [Oscillospiraceae bacterium MB08-C2-2]|nr:DNA polymerase III subunit delta [Oscillospiraceae bacterium MB08-C2-2]